MCQLLPAGVSAGAEAARRADTAHIIYLFRDALWSARADGSGAHPLTRGLSVYAFDVTQDGRRVAFAAGAWRGERKRRELVESEVWMVNADGTGLRRLATASKLHGGQARVGHLRWAPDGESLAFDVPGGPRAAAGAGVLYVVRPADGAVHTAAAGAVQGFAWTPDGRIMYQPSVSGAEGRAAERTVPPAAAAGPPAGVLGPAGGNDEVAASPPPLPPDAVRQPQPSPPPPSAEPASPAAPARPAAALAPPSGYSGAGGE